MAKPGNKEGATAEPIPLMVPRGGDYLDNYDNPPVLVVPTVKQDPSVEPESGEKTAEIPQPQALGRTNISSRPKTSTLIRSNPSHRSRKRRSR